MGSFLSLFSKKQDIPYRPSLYEPLNNQDPYASIDLHNNLDFIDLNDKIDKLKNQVELCESNINLLEEHTQRNIKSLSEDIHHINNKINNM